MHVCEVGPGPGSITREILHREGEHLTVVEKDKRFLPLLQYISDVMPNKMTIVHGDILQYDISQAFPNELAKSWKDDPPPFCVFGNLPFNISLPLLFKWLDLISRQEGVFELGRIPFVLTFQAEVAERLVAPPGTPQRSRLSILSQYLCDIDYRFVIKGRSFIPPPKVEVGAVKITPLKKREIDLPFHSVDMVVKHVISGQRQRPCKKGASTLFPPRRKDLVEEIFQISGVTPSTRAYMLDNLHFRDLCYAYEDIAKRIPQLKLVDTFDPNMWSKTYFDKDGNPRNNINVEALGD
ncbi:dimethyladenosine transferase 1, mitochondrial-like isoform X2 [Clavelina lepadiformis]